MEYPSFICSPGESYFKLSPKAMKNWGWESYFPWYVPICIRTSEMRQNDCLPLTFVDDYLPTCLVQAHETCLIQTRIHVLPIFTSIEEQTVIVIILWQQSEPDITFSRRHVAISWPSILSLLKPLMMRPSTGELFIWICIDLQGGASWDRSEWPNDCSCLDAMVDAFLRGGTVMHKSHCKISTGWL